MGTSAVWCGSGFQGILIGFSLGQAIADITFDKTKLVYSEGRGMPYISTNFLLWQKPLGHLKGGGGGIWGLNHPGMALLT